MKQFPSKLKYKKYQKYNFFYKETIEKNSFHLNSGEYGIQSIEWGKITFKQIEACRRTIKRGLKKLGLIWIKLFTNIPVYKKPLASRMGKGKGNLSYWISPIKKGEILFEISGVNKWKAKFILEKSRTKLPLKTKIIKNYY